MHISANLAVSLDGKISIAGHPRERLGSQDDLRRMLRLRDAADAVLVGGNTYRAWPLPLVGHRKGKWLNVIVTGSGNLPGLDRVGKDPRVEVLVLTNKTHVQIKAEAEILPALTPETMIKSLASRGVKRLLLECGGRLLTPFLQKGLVDDLFLTLCPWIVGSGDDLVTAANSGWHFAQQETYNGETFLRLRKANRRIK